MHTPATGSYLPPAVMAGEFRRLMTQWPTGVAVVTTGTGSDPVGCTVSTLMSLSVDPPLLLVSLAATSYTLSVIRHAGAFAVNVLPWDQRDLCQRFAEGDQPQRFRTVEVEVEHGIPVLARASAAAVCRVHETVACGDHVLVVGAPVWNRTDDSRPPLVIHGRQQRRLD